MTKKEDNEKSEMQATGASDKKDMPLDTRLLSEAIIELNISRKNVGIYPPGHVQITKSIDRAFHYLQRLFEIRPEMTIGVAKDTLLIGNDYLDRQNPVYRDFALALNSRGIATVTFTENLSREEMVCFQRILTTRSADIPAAGGIEKVMADSSIEHIRIGALNYGSFHLTEEEEIFKTRGKTNEKPGADVWHDFVSLLAAGRLDNSGQGISLRDAEQIDPAELARLLNDRKFDAGVTVQSYDRIVSDYIRESAEKSKLTSEQSKTLASLNTLLKDLNPEIRKQFLSVAFQRASAASSHIVEEIVGGFTDDMVIEMLAQANFERREISPTLASVVGKLSRSHEPGPAADGGKIRTETGFVVPQMVPEQMQKLFAHEKYDDYVGPEYREMLKQMGEDAPISPAVEFPLENYENLLDESHLDFQIGRALLAFLEEDIDEEDYEAFSLKLTVIVPGFLESGNFELLFDISETLKRHAAEKNLPGIREIAGKTRNIFSDPEFIKKAISAFEVWIRDKGQEAANLIKSLGPDAVPGLIDIFSRDETPGGRHVLFNLLCLFGEPSVREAHNCLRDPRTYFVRNLLMLIRRAGTPASLPHVKPLLQHHDFDVRMEALSAVLKFKDPESTQLLRDAIRSADPDVSSQGVLLAGQYRVAEVAEDMLARIKRVILFETDFTVNGEIIKALGEIGDPRAIPDLEKLARAGFSLYPQSLMRMKEAIFGTLEKYPRESIGPLLKIGARLNSDAIRRLCKKFSERQ